MWYILPFMTNVNRIRVSLAGTAVVGPGVATHYWLGTATPDDVVAVRAFWYACSALMPQGMSITVPNQGEIIDDNTGDLVGAWTESTSATFAGGLAQAYSKGVGARVVWPTNGTTGNRHVRGSTYVVPLAGTKFDLDGTLTTSAVTDLKAAADGLLDALQDRLVIVTRRTDEHSGTSHAVTSTLVPDTPSWLRSRRT